MKRPAIHVIVAAVAIVGLWVGMFIASDKHHTPEIPTGWTLIGDEVKIKNLSYSNSNCVVVRRFSEIDISCVPVVNYVK